MKNITKKPNVGFKEFCAQTSLHGWSFLAFERNKIPSTLFWLMAMTVALILCCSLTFKNVNEFLEEVEFNVQTLTATLDHVYFPSMYVMNKGFNRMSPHEHLFQDSKINNLAQNVSMIELVEHKVITGKPMNEIEKRIAENIVNSNFTRQMFNRFVNENKQRYPDITSGHIYHNHSIQQMSDEEIRQIWRTLSISMGGYYRNIFGFTQLRQILFRKLHIPTSCIYLFLLSPSIQKLLPTLENFIGTSWLLLDYFRVTSI